MTVSNTIEVDEVTSEDSVPGADRLRPLLDACAAISRSDAAAVMTGELVGITDSGSTALVCIAGHPGTAAVRARTVVDLHGPHIGGQVVLNFECGDITKPIVMGVLRPGACWPLSERPGQVELDADGARLVVSAKEQLVLRCGKASITLTKTGKVLIQGTYLLSRSSGVNRIKGGSVHLN